jgi:hypothetical protein
MIATLERRLIGAPKNIYKPKDFGFETLLGERPIKIVDTSDLILENNLNIQSATMLRLENKNNLVRRIVLLEDKNGHKAAVYFYQDHFDPKREKKHPDGESYLKSNVFQNLSTIGQVRIISTKSKEERDGESLLLKADNMAVNMANNPKFAVLKNDNEIQLSGSGIVIVTDTETKDFLELEDFHHSIGELFREDGIFGNNLILPGIVTRQLIENMKVAGANVLSGPKGIPDLINFLSEILEKSGQAVTNEKLLKALPFLAYIPYHAQYFTRDSTDLLMGYAHLPFDAAKIKYIKDQIVNRIKSWVTDGI